MICEAVRSDLEGLELSSETVKGLIEKKVELLVSVQKSVAESKGTGVVLSNDVLAEQESKKNAKRSLRRDEALLDRLN